MVKVEMNDESQLDALLSADQYSEMIGEYVKLLDYFNQGVLFII